MGPFRADLPIAALVVIGLAYAILAAGSVALAVIDARTHRLPNRWVLPGYPILIVLLTVACLCGAPWSSLLRSVVAGAVLFAFYLLLRMLGPGGMGGGDVKLAGVLGVALGWVGWGALAVGAVAGFVLGGVYGVMLIALRRASAKTAVPFGPWMLAGAWVGILFGEDLGHRLLALPV